MVKAMKKHHGTASMKNDLISIRKDQLFHDLKNDTFDPGSVECLNEEYELLDLKLQQLENKKHSQQVISEDSSSIIWFQTSRP